MPAGCGQSGRWLGCDMVIVKDKYTFVAALSAIVVILLLVGCGGRKHRTPVQPTLSIEHPVVAVSTEYSLNDALLRLSALETPEGINAELFQQLKNELAKQLNAKGISKMVSAPPIGDANRVDDLELVDDGAGAYNLTWHYRNAGDYDQSNAVGISDITPIAMHYGETYDIENTNCLLSVIDGGCNGVIDIADITPIAMNFGSECAGYSIQGSNTADGGFTELVTVPFSLAENEGRFLFTVPQPESEFSFVAVAPFDSGNNIGVLSNPVRITRGDWWMFGREPTHSRRSPYVGAQTATLRWRYETEDKIGSSPAIGIGGTIYVGSGNNCLYAISRDGTLVWTYETGDHIYSSPAVDVDGTVYVGSHDCHLYAIKADGSLKWRYETGDWVLSCPAIGADGTVYVGSKDYCVYAISSEGALRWSYETEGEVQSSPAMGADGTVYVGNWDNRLYAISPEGALKWSYETGSDVRSSPAIGADGTIYVGSIDNYLYAIRDDETEGTLKWQYETGDAIWSSPAIGADGTVYVGSDDCYLYAITDDESEGILKWRYETGDRIFSSPAIGADDTVYVASYDDYLYAITDDGTEGTLKWKYDIGDNGYSSPAIGEDGAVYVGSFDGSLYAFLEPGSESPPSINWVSPLSEVTGEEVTFIADVWGTTPFTYSWSFDGGADPDVSTEPSPTVVLGTIGEYDASLTVTNEFGLDTFDFTLTVEEAIPEITWVRPGGSIIAEYHYAGASLCGITVYFYFDVSKRSGDVEVTASIAGEQDTSTFPVEQGERYQLSVYVGVVEDWFSHQYELVVSSPSAALPTIVPMEGKFRFTYLGAIGLGPY